MKRLNFGILHLRPPSPFTVVITFTFYHKPTQSAVHIDFAPVDCIQSSFLILQCILEYKFNAEQHGPLRKQNQISSFKIKISISKVNHELYESKCFFFFDQHFAFVKNTPEFFNVGATYDISMKTKISKVPNHVACVHLVSKSIKKKQYFLNTYNSLFGLKKCSFF